MNPDDIESCRVPAAQLALLQPYRVRHVLERHGQSAYVAENLFYRGLLSFDPKAVVCLTLAQEAELDCLCAITKVVGLRGVEGVLDGLLPPYAYRMSELVYDFARARWSVRPDERREVA